MLGLQLVEVREVMARLLARERVRRTRDDVETLRDESVAHVRLPQDGDDLGGLRSILDDDVVQVVADGSPMRPWRRDIDPAPSSAAHVDAEPLGQKPLARKRFVAS